MNKNELDSRKGIRYRFLIPLAQYPFEEVS